MKMDWWLVSPRAAESPTLVFFLLETGEAALEDVLSDLAAGDFV